MSHEGETRVTAGPFQPGSRTCASWRKADESNAHGSSPCPGFRDQLPAIQQYLPRWRRVRESNPLASCESPCLADKCLTVRRRTAPWLLQEPPREPNRHRLANAPEIGCMDLPIVGEFIGSAKVFPLKWSFKPGPEGYSATGRSESPRNHLP